MGQGHELTCARQLELPLKLVGATHSPTKIQPKEHIALLLRHLLRKSWQPLEEEKWRRHVEDDVGDMCLEEGQRRHTSRRRMVHG